MAITGRLRGLRLKSLRVDCDRARWHRHRVRVETLRCARGTVIDAGFGLTDSHESASVVFDGILVDLFHEVLGVAAIGALDRNGTFVASEVLARHDENYMPPGVAETLERFGRMPRNRDRRRRRHGREPFMTSPPP